MGSLKEVLHDGHDCDDDVDEVEDCMVFFGSYSPEEYVWTDYKTIDTYL